MRIVWSCLPRILPRSDSTFQLVIPVIQPSNFPSRNPVLVLVVVLRVEGSDEDKNLPFSETLFDTRPTGDLNDTAVNVRQPYGGPLD